MMNALIERYCGKRYVAGIQDCYSLVQEYFAQEVGVELTNYARPYNWDQLSDLNFFQDKFHSEGFVETQNSPHHVRRGDALLMRLLKNRQPNHVAVYVGGNKILHHLSGRKSELVDYSDRWRFRVSHVLRHPDTADAFSQDALPQVINHAPLHLKRAFRSQ